MYISITGIKYKGFFKTLKFWIYTVPSFIAARKAEGNIFCEQKKIGEYHHTLTAWKNKEKMMNYIKSKSHLKAMQNFQSIGTGSTFGFEGSEIPNWNEALKIWKDNFREI
jgi:hypothetical protein